MTLDDRKLWLRSVNFQTGVWVRPRWPRIESLSEKEACFYGSPCTITFFAPVAAEAQCTYIHYVSSILCIFNRAYLHNNKTRPEHQETQLYNGLFIIVSPFVPACLLDCTDSRFLNNPRHDFNTLSHLNSFFQGWGCNIFLPLFIEADANLEINKPTVYLHLIFEISSVTRFFFQFRNIKFKKLKNQFDFEIDFCRLHRQ